jgi:hypothetical protein
LCFFFQSNAQHLLHFDVMKATPCDSLTRTALCQVTQAAVSAAASPRPDDRSDAPLYLRKTEQYRTLAGADQERSQLTLQDRFEAHDLDSRLLNQLRQQLQRYPICRASLVKKRLRFFPEQPLYILLVDPSHSQVDSTLGTQIAQELKFGRDLLVRLSVDCEPSLLEQILDKADGNLVH